jgi:hypothetical protein
MDYKTFTNWLDNFKCNGKEYEFGKDFWHTKLEKYVPHDGLYQDIVDAIIDSPLDKYKFHMKYKLELPSSNKMIKLNTRIGDILFNIQFPNDSILKEFKIIIQKDNEVLFDIKKSTNDENKLEIIIPTLWIPFENVEIHYECEHDTNVILDWYIFSKELREDILTNNHELYFSIDDKNYKIFEGGLYLIPKNNKETNVKDYTQEEKNQLIKLITIEQRKVIWMYDIRKPESNKCTPNCEEQGYFYNFLKNVCEEQGYTISGSNFTNPPGHIIKKLE